ncbi:MAG: hypothetical protein WD490_03545 [Opitutales bacterium]
MAHYDRACRHYEKDLASMIRVLSLPSAKASLNDLLREIREGKIQLPDFHRGNTFAQFIEDRRRQLLALIEHAMGKQVSLFEEKEEYETGAAEASVG